MTDNIIWPIAFVFVGGFFAMAWASVDAPPKPKSPQVTCIEQRGAWIAGWGTTGWAGTCKFKETK